MKNDDVFCLLFTTGDELTEEIDNQNFFKKYFKKHLTNSTKKSIIQL